MNSENTTIEEEIVEEVRNRNAGISVLNIDYSGDPQVQLVERTNLPTEYPTGGERVVSVDIADGWYGIAANEALAAEDGGWTGDFGPNEIKWSAESVEEAVKLAERAFDE